MNTDQPAITATPESRPTEGTSSNPLLLQIRSDRRLGHEWDDWDGEPLPDGGVFQERETVFFQLTLASVLVTAAAGAGGLWLIGPRLAELWQPLPRYAGLGIATIAVLAILWLAAIAAVLKTGRNWLPGRMAERGLLPWLMPKLEWSARVAGLSRDRVGNAALRVHNRLAVARGSQGISPDELLILLPRCLAKDAMQTAMGISKRYGVPLFVAARGRYARQMIAMRHPKAVVAVACERDLVSGVHDAAPHLPVLGTTLQLGDGPCRNTRFAASELEAQVRLTLGLETAVDGAAVGR